MLSHDVQCVLISVLLDMWFGLLLLSLRSWVKSWEMELLMASLVTNRITWLYGLLHPSIHQSIFYHCLPTHVSYILSFGMDHFLGGNTFL